MINDEQVDDLAFMQGLLADRARARRLAADVLEQVMATGRLSDRDRERLQTEPDRVCGEYYLLIRELRGERS